MTQAGTDVPLRMVVPGDKSVTHRALLFGALATGVTHVRRPLISADTLSTAAVLRQLHVAVPPLDPRGVDLTGVGLRGFQTPTDVLDCGNSGTTCRLLIGALASQPLRATLTGDSSLRGRPMARVTDPLSKMGARFEWSREPGVLPVTVAGGDLRPIDIATGVSSAQVKSAILLAGLTSGQFVLVTEPHKSRDHTERFLAAMGAPTISHNAQGGWRVELRDPPDGIHGIDVTVPGDFSTAAFPLVWALCRPEGPPLELVGVGLNPTRTGLLDVLRRMGARFDVLADDTTGPEPTGSIVAYPSRLHGTEVGGAEIPAMIDEIPALFIAALFAEGVTSIRGAGELRVKESDRIDALARNLRAIGADVEESTDGLRVVGNGGRVRGSVETFGDHRVEMAFGVLEVLSDGAVRVPVRAAAEVSFPEFWSEFARLEAENRRDRGASNPAGRQTKDESDVLRPTRRRPVVTIDGPSGSGKSTTARAVARRLGLVHLDTGSLYRAVAYALLEAGVPDTQWERLDTAYFENLGLTASVEGGRVSLSRSGSPIGDEVLRTPRVTAAVSRVAALPAVRAALIDLQRDAARDGGLVADGRDLGTVVFPDAEAKFFLVADLEERARRRLLEQRDTTLAKPASGDVDAPRALSEETEVAVMAQQLHARDFEDAHREHSPLRRPEDAVVIDTTALTPDEQLERVLERVLTVWSR